MSGLAASTVVDVARRYAHGFAPAAHWALPAACVGLAFFVLPSHLLPERARRWGRPLIGCLTAGLGILWGWKLGWIADDAFISFRYAEHLARGDGLVFNVGERVEGYTDFLWTLILSLGARLGAGPPQLSVILGLASFAALILLTARVARLTAPPDTELVVSLAAMCCAAQYLMASYATSGLETMLGSALVMGALERALAGRYGAAGLLAVLATMTHPDHAVFYAALFAALLVAKDTRRGAREFLIPFVFVYVPYFVWRYRYYGDLFPNTYYAKSANLSYFSQGVVYVWVTLVGTGFFAILPLAAYGLWVLRRSVLGRFCAIAIPVFTLYAMKIGGDFMYGRLFCPLLGPILLLCERGLRQLLLGRRYQRVLALCAAACMCVTVVPVRLFKPFEKRWNLADERTFYALKSFNPIEVDSLYFGWARTLTKLFEPYASRPKLELQSVGIVSYYTGLPVVDGFGLTDRAIARRPIATRGRPGHEKAATPGYVVARGVDFSEIPIYPPPYETFTRARLAGLRFFVANYDPAIIEPLRRRPGVHIYDLRAHLQRASHDRVLPGREEDAACDAWFAREVYYSSVPDAALRGAYERQLLDAGRAPGTKKTDGALYAFESTHVRDPSTAIHFDPGELANFQVDPALRPGFGVLDTVPPQGTPKNQRGPFLDTYVAGSGDAARGTIRSRPFPLRGDVMELWTGGGRLRDGLGVSLIVDGQRVHSAAGCNTEMLGRRLWQISPYKGRQAVLEITDDAVVGWGHLLVDEVVQWVPRAG